MEPPSPHLADIILIIILKIHSLLVLSGTSVQFGTLMNKAAENILQICFHLSYLKIESKYSGS